MGTTPEVRIIWNKKEISYFFKVLAFNFIYYFLVIIQYKSSFFSKRSTNKNSG